MKLLRVLLSSKPIKQTRPKKVKKPFGILLLDKTAGTGLKWVKSRWNADLWNQDQ